MYGQTLKNYFSKKKNPSNVSTSTCLHLLHTDEKEKYDPSGFRDSVVQGLNEAGTDLEAASKFLDKAGSLLDYRRYSETLLDILFAGGILGVYETRDCGRIFHSKPQIKDSQTRSRQQKKKLPVEQFTFYNVMLKNTGSHNCGTGCEIAPDSHLICVGNWQHPKKQMYPSISSSFLGYCL